MTHDVENCERCQLNLILYGETFYRVESGEFIEHVDVPSMIMVRREPRPEMVAAFKARFGGTP